MLSTTQPAVLLKQTPVKWTLRKPDSDPFLPTFGRPFHTEPRDWPSQHCLERTTYNYTVNWLCCLKMICVNWKGSDQTFNSGEWGSNWEGKKQDGRPLLTKPCSYSLHSARNQPVHHSLKKYSLHHWTVNLCFTNCYNTTYNNGSNFHKDSVGFFRDISLCAAH